MKGALLVSSCLPALFCTLVASAQQRPVSAELLAYDPAKPPCYSSYYFDPYDPVRFIPFRHDVRKCGDGLIDSGGRKNYAHVTLALRDTTVIALTFAAPVTEVTVRRCFGCGDVLNKAADVEVSADSGATWLRASEWTREGLIDEGPRAVIWKRGQQYVQSNVQEESTVALGTSARVVLIRGVKVKPNGDAGPTWFPDIFSVKARGADQARR